MMNKEMIDQLFLTANSWTPLVIRLTIGLVIFPHAVQKLFGWFNGPGLKGEMKFMTTVVGLSTFTAVAAITIECLGCFMLIAGAGTRIAAAGLFALFVGIILRVHWRNGYFMNWFGKLPAGKEGFEFHLLMLGLCLASFLQGGGKWSIDWMLTN